ncbi:hypothetical protein J5X91_08870 [Pseudoalteromonas sp. K222D]|uniref:hypothetical protein n=1 Tax=Pseudoalteromonas sp. K222D TaxID=2820756 RepID=UPI001AD6965C|nr:hypothetical protein [Pseudoalteromonas sp. K222D]MBO7926380.1 hypothetical protein [Pseudoalteromonas sp. K222D]
MVLSFSTLLVIEHDGAALLPAVTEPLGQLFVAAPETNQEYLHPWGQLVIEELTKAPTLFAIPVYSHPLHDVLTIYWIRYGPIFKMYTH